MSRVAAHRMSPVDAVWAGHWSAVAIGPLDLPTGDQVRAAVADFLDRCPGDPMACRMDAAAGRWVRLAPAERAAHAAAVVRVLPDDGPDPVDDEPPVDYEAEIVRHRPAVDAAVPVQIVLGRHHAVVYVAHPLGDAATFTEIALRLVRADGAALSALSERAGLGLPLRTAVRQPRAVYRAWVRRALGGLRRRTPGAPTELQPAPTTELQPEPAPTTAPGGPSVPGVVGAVLDNVELRGLTRWRNAHAPGASITAVLTALTYRSLRDRGLRVAGDRYYSLFDLRTYRDGDVPVWGNLAKSLLLNADLADPASIDQAMREAIDSRRAVPALLAGAVLGALTRPLARRHHRSGPGASGPGASGPGASGPVHPGPVVPGPVTMTFNSMPTLPGLAALPWAAEGRRRYLGVGYPTSPTGISVFAVRFRDRMELTASFDASVLDPAAVRSALVAVGRPDEP